MPQAALGLRAALDSIPASNRVVTENSQSIPDSETRGVGTNNREDNFEVDGQPDEDLNNQSTDQSQMEGDGPNTPRTALEAYTERLNTAKVRAEFEASLMTVLTLNVLYMYYVDHKLIVLFIRATQVVRLLYYPFASEPTQRSTSVLILLTNIMVVLIHVAMLLQSEQPARMLFINFIGPEPKSAYKVVFLDTLIILLEVLLLQCRAEPSDRMLLTGLPIPLSRGNDGRIPSSEPEEEAEASDTT